MRTIRVRRPANIGAIAFAVVGVASAIVVGFLAWPSAETNRQAVIPSEAESNDSSVTYASDASSRSAVPMVRIPADSYPIGSDDGNASECEKPRQPVPLAAFEIDSTEVTTAEYVRCVRAGQCESTMEHALANLGRWRGDLCNEYRMNGRDPVGDHPINCVDRKQASDYCTFVRKRLPTSEEWEAAARGRAGLEYPWGDMEPQCGDAVFGTTHRPNRCGREEGTAPVMIAGRTTATGLHGMAGNVWEWATGSCLLSERRGLLRGGGFDYSARSLHTWDIEPFDPETGGVSCGFRCARSAAE